MILVQRLSVKQQILQVLKDLLVLGRDWFTVCTSTQDALESCLLAWSQMVQVWVSQVEWLAVDDLIFEIIGALFLLRAKFITISLHFKQLRD